MGISVRVLLHANFREIVGKREIFEEVEADSTLNNILNELANRYGRDFKQIVNQETGTISLEFLVSINGQIVRDPNTRLNNGDILILTIPAGGG